jgi:photosystem II stability/assembly factor-like uncharacterized protein
MLLGAAYSATAQSHWFRVARPTTQGLNKVEFVDSLQGWVVGDSGVIFKTTDSGQSWLPQSSGLFDNIVSLSIVNQSCGYALATKDYQNDSTWYGTRILKTTNGGDVWTHQDYPPPFFRTIHFLDSLNGFIGGDLGRISKTTDGGLSWTPTMVDSSVFSSFPIFELSFYSRSLGFALGGHYDLAGVVWRTTNGGDRWSAASWSSDPMRGIHYIDSVHIISVGGDFEYGSGLIKTKDGGRSWEYVYLGVWGDARAIALRTPAEGWAPLGFTGTYMTTSDTGRTWTSFYSPDTSALYDVAFPDSTHGFMVGSNGTILKYSLTVVGVELLPSQLPAAFKLFQNYPNPFNPSTTITYELAAGSSVSLDIFDAAGRRITTLFNGTQTAGVHHLEFDGTTLASGTYFYELTAGNANSRTTQVRKMVLLK